MLPPLQDRSLISKRQTQALSLHLDPHGLPQASEGKDEITITQEIIDHPSVLAAHSEVHENHLHQVHNQRLPSMPALMRTLPPDREKAWQSIEGGTETSPVAPGLLPDQG